MEWVDDTIVSNVDQKQFGGLAGTSTTDALVEMTHNWYEATDTLNTYVRIVLLDFSKAFDLINHNILLEYKHSAYRPPSYGGWRHFCWIEHNG